MAAATDSAEFRSTGATLNITAAPSSPLPPGIARANEAPLSEYRGYNLREGDTMGAHTCQWIFLPSPDEPNERVCGAPVEGDSKYCAIHQMEVDALLKAPDRGVDDI